MLDIYESVQKTMFLTVPFVYAKVLYEGGFQNPFKLNRYVIESLLNKYQKQKKKTDKNTSLHVAVRAS